MKNQEAFTLIEVLIAVTIFAVGFTVIVDGYSTIRATAARNMNLRYVSSKAENQLIQYANGYDFSAHGYFDYNGIDFNWRIEENYREDGVVLKYIVEWQSLNSMRNYSIERFIPEGAEDG